MPRRDEVIKFLFEKATENYSNISDIHQKLLKLGYNKPFSVFLRELKARVIYRKICE